MGFGLFNFYSSQDSMLLCTNISNEVSYLIVHSGKALPALLVQALLSRDGENLSTISANINLCWCLWPLNSQGMYRGLLFVQFSTELVWFA